MVARGGRELWAALREMKLGGAAVNIGKSPWTPFGWGSRELTSYRLAEVAAEDPRHY